jgi:hypothetical protein
MGSLRDVDEGSEGSGISAASLGSEGGYTGPPLVQSAGAQPEEDLEGFDGEELVIEEFDEAEESHSQS